MTWKETIDTARNISYAIMELGLCPEIEGDGSTWRFMGIQAKNRKEWILTHVADIHQSITSVALYDTLGADAMRFVVKQTELTTVAVSIEFVKKLSQLKIDDMSMDE
jgi:long-subunit acyl-CoA synthetase (AMP-forming)